MTVSSNVSKATYDGDGSTTVFAVPFLFNAKADVSVTHADAAGAETNWVENTQYTLAGVGNPAGGTLTVKTTPTNYTPAAGERLTIKRVVAQTQETDYPEGGEFPAKAHEDALDKLTFQVHDLQEQIGRNLTAPATDQSSSLEIPNETLRASKFLAFDGSGKPVAAAGTSADLTPVSAFMNTLLDDGDAATARGTLALVIGTDVLPELAVISQADAESGSATDERIFTAERVKQAIAALETVVPANLAQIVTTQTGAVATGTTVLPYDDTVPQNTEGNEFMTLAITPTDSASKLIVEVVVCVSNSIAGNIGVALFQDSTAAALAAAYDRNDGGANSNVIAFKHIMTAGTTSATTFKVRAGPQSAATVTINGHSSSRIGGGVMASSITITEILP